MISAIRASFAKLCAHSHRSGRRLVGFKGEKPSYKQKHYHMWPFDPQASTGYWLQVDSSGSRQFQLGIVRLFWL